MRTQLAAFLILTDICGYSIDISRIETEKRKRESWRMFALDDLLILLLSDKLIARSILWEICFIFALIRLSI